MSSMRYVSAKAHVVTDSKPAVELANRVAEVFGGSDWAVDEREFDSVEGEGYEEAEVKASGFDVDEMISSVEELLKEVATLSNGSYGLLVVESDFGVDLFDCYGGVEHAEAESVDEGLFWASEDFLDLSVSMRASEWQEVLDCSLESIAEEIEARGDDLLSELLPDAFVQACEGDGDVFFEYSDIEPFSESGAYGESDEIAVTFELDGHELTNETLMAMIEALNCGPDELPVPGTKTLLRFLNADEENGVYENRMADTNSYALLVFESSWGEIGNVRVLVPRMI